MKYARPLSITLATLLVVATLPIFLIICGLTIMVFDQGYSAWGFALFGTVVGVSIIVPTASLIGSIMLIRRNKKGKGLLISLIPAIVLAVFWMWISTQSFS